MHPVITDLSNFRDSVKSCVVLYSGDFDSSYFLLWAQRQNIQTVAVLVHLGAGEPSDTIASRAIKLGVVCRSYNLTSMFAKYFLTLAIQSGTLYPQSYTICSLLSQSLIAEAILKVAREEDVECVVHPSTFIQNSSLAFNNAVRALAPNIRIAYPFIHDSIRHQDKRRELAEAGIELTKDTHNLDENIWGRVITGGDLDDPGKIISASTWKITGNPADSLLQTSTVTLEFENGIPVSLNKEFLPLEEIILRLNIIGGKYGMGRFNNLRDTPTGFKNHEVVEAPGARIILEAHTALERAILTQGELRIKSLADLEWTTLITHGLWYSPLRESLSSLIASINRLVNGEVVLEISPRNLFVSAVRSSYILHPSVIEPAILPEFDDFSNQGNAEIMALQLRLNANCWQPAKTTLSLRVEDLP